MGNEARETRIEGKHIEKDASFTEFLSSEEAKTLDSAAAQRLMGKLDRAIYQAGEALREATIVYAEARAQFQKAKFYRDILVERARNLKNFIRMG